MTQDIHPLLLCGGSGTRLWPLSRKSYPKQFAPLTGERSLFQASALRLSGPGFAAPTVITGSDYRFIVTEQLAAVEIAPAGILIEPEARNTAPAICAAAVALHDRAPGALMLVAPSDHVIPDADAFRDTVAAAVAAARSGRIVTFGIRPDRAETGYGWLEPVAEPDGLQPLKAFVEKPDAATAQAMLDGRKHLWNAGIFLFSTEAILAAFEAYAPDMLAGVRQAVAEGSQDLGFTRLAPAPWAGLADLSIDYAVMEKADNLSVMPYEGGWSDLGGWEAVWREAGPDEAGIVTNGPATAIECHNVLLRAESEDQQLVGIGLQDIVAIAIARRRAGRPQGPRARGQARRHNAQGPGRVAGRYPAARLPALGLVRKPGGRCAVPGQAHRRASRRGAEPAKPPSPRRALDRRRGDGQGHRGRQGTTRDREPVRLHPARRRASHGKPRQGSDGADRGADRQLPGRRRHHPLRRRLRPWLSLRVCCCSGPRAVSGAW
ncbi:Mannose-1-phosphate guanylyltransferase (GDP) [Roseibacterium elongatum DSM 19469]|uniref:Mannose-1-phosphate guanylyltransferase (GDP) n=1 Tax=Roseicyclus elongatus DSM 19469 TaxID=1294273 RepID=W8S4L3_9RHOB|nr:Mannose-1-phosphate guanylyltransferase (GDP) [Roseibacterium elongatum DSM 19469]